MNFELLSNRFCRSGLSVCVSVSHQNFGLITTTKGLNTSLHLLISGNTQCMVYLKVGEAVCSSIFQAFVAVVLFPDCATRNSTQIRLGTRLSWARIYGARIRVQSMSASHSHSTGIVPRRWNKVWERGVSVPWTPLVYELHVHMPLHVPITHTIYALFWLGRSYSAASSPLKWLRLRVWISKQYAEG